MREENSNILSSAINDLPLHRADTKVWDRLENSLFDYPINAIPLHSPDPGLWERIEGNVMASSGGKKLFNKRWLAVLLLLLVSTAGYLGITYENAPKVSPETQSTLPITEVEKQVIEEVTVVEEPAEGYSQEANEPQNIKETTAFSPITKTKEKHHDARDAAPHSDADMIASSQNYNGLRQGHMNRNTYLLAHIQSRKLELHLSEASIHQSTREDMECSSFTGSSPVFTLGVSGDYHIFLASSQIDDTQLQYWISSGLEVGYHKNRWTILSGLGMIFSEDKSKLEYQYIQNELIHSYEYVDSVHFDPVTGTTHYYTTTVDVYDSVEYQEEEQIESSYIYLQIPLFVGYEIFRKNAFSMSISGGLSYAYLLRQTETYPGFNKEEARLIGTTSKLNNRKDHLLQFHTRLGFQYEVSRNICIDLHPAFNYINSPIYENGTKNPYAWSIGASIRFKL